MPLYFFELMPYCTSDLTLGKEMRWYLQNNCNVPRNDQLCAIFCARILMPFCKITAHTEWK